jgi:SAM-dependent methyltransferase
MKRNFHTFNLKLDKSRSDYSFWNEIPRKISADMTVREKEVFSQYDGFTFWYHKKLLEHDNLEVLDLGSTKTSNALLSLKHSVTAIVLSDPKDEVSNVQYHVIDASQKLPFENSKFDVFTSTASIQLIGLGRYGDNLEPYAIPNFISELDRVLRGNASIYISMALGTNQLKFNSEYEFDFSTIKEIFVGWNLVDFLIDRASWLKENISFPKGERYSKDFGTPDSPPEGHCVVFLHFQRS